MNKLKLIIPSLGLLLVSTVGTVSGSLAWFSANRAVTVSTTDFKVGSLDGDLDVTVTKLVGTTVSDKVVSIVTNGQLTDASVDHVNKKVYTGDKDTLSDGEQPTAFVEKGSFATDPASETAWKVEESTNEAPFYYAIAWKMTFSNNFGGNVKPLDLFFCPEESNATSVVPTGEESKEHTYNGFRIGFFAGDEKFVWAPFRSSANVTGLVNTHRTTAEVNPDTSFPNGMHYIKATGGADYAAWGSYTANSDIITGFGGDPSNKAEAGASGHSDRVDYLGQLTPSASTLEVTCVAWYEGDDPTVVNSSSKDAVSSSLKFYVRQAE